MSDTMDPRPSSEVVHERDGYKVLKTPDGKLGVVDSNGCAVPSHYVWDAKVKEWVPPEDYAPGVVAEIIDDYIADVRDCLEQIDVATRRLADAKESAIESLKKWRAIRPADRNRIFKDFYWGTLDAPIPIEPILEGFGLNATSQIRDLATKTNVCCRICGEALIVKSRKHLREVNARLKRQDVDARVCPDCLRLRKEMTQTPPEQDRKSHRQVLDDLDRRIQTRLRALRSMPYAEYLRTPEWYHTRADALKSARYRCQLCGAFQWVTLDVHHNTYERLGEELPADLIVLCRPCHTKHHTELPGMGGEP